MRAVRLVDGVAHVADVDPPRGEGVHVQVAAAGICGSDLHLVASGWSIPVTLGHEISGTTDDGTAVAVEPVAACGSCDQCRAGATQRCRRGAEVLIGIGVDGGMANELVVPERAVHPLPEGLALGDACLVEPLAVAVRAVEQRAAVRPRERVLVIGGGTIGLCATAVAASAGATVELAARYEHQQEAGTALGAEPASGASEYDVVIEAAGSESALRDALRHARPGGVVATVATYWNAVTLPAFALGTTEVDVRPSSMYGSEEMRRAVALLATRPEVAARLITHRYPLEAAPEAFATAERRSGGAIKVVLEP